MLGRTEEDDDEEEEEEEEEEEGGHQIKKKKTNIARNTYPLHPSAPAPTQIYIGIKKEKKKKNYL